MRRGPLRALLLLLLLAGGASAGEPPVLEYAYPDQSVLSAGGNDRGEAENPLTPLAEAIFRKAGVAWRSRPLPAARLFESLRDGGVDVSMLVKGPTLESCCLVGSRTVAATELRVYRRKGMPPVTRREDLAGKEIITLRGYTYGSLVGFIRDPVNRIGNNATQGHDSAFTMLELGRADYLLDYSGPAEEVLARRSGERPAFDVLERLDIRLVVRRTLPDAEAVLARLDAASEGLGSRR